MSFLPGLSRRLPHCRKITVRGHSRLAPGLGDCCLPSGAVGYGVQEPPCMVHMIGVAGRDEFPGVAGRVSCQNTERAKQPFLAVSPVVGQRLAGPLPRDQHPASRVAEVIGVMGLALAPAGDQAGPGVLGLDAVPEPVRADREHGWYRSVSASRAACARWASVSGWWQSPTCLVRYLVRYPMHRAASLEPARTPWASNRTPNRATWYGSPSSSRAWSQVGRTSPVTGSR